MKMLQKYLQYPAGTVIRSNLNTLAIYATGLYILSRAGWLFAVVYLAYILTLEYRLIRYHCVNCYYWGKTCGSGRGRISSRFFRQGNPQDFCNKQITWKFMIPDMLVSLIPLTAAIFLLISHFNPLLLSALLVLLLASTIGNGYIRGSLTCKYCKQQEIGCPAERLFNKEN